MFECTEWQLEEPNVRENNKFDLITPTIVKPAKNVLKHNGTEVRFTKCLNTSAYLPIRNLCNNYKICQLIALTVENVITYELLVLYTHD